MTAMPHDVMPKDLMPKDLMPKDLPAETLACAEFIPCLARFHNKNAFR